MFIIIFCVIITSVLIILITKYREKSRNTPPGPFPWPIVGNMRVVKQLTKKHGAQYKAYVELSKIYKSNVIKLYLGSMPLLIVCGFEAIESVLKNEAFDARPWTELLKMRNMGLKKGVGMSEGAEWREMRPWFVRSLRQLGFGRDQMSNKITDELKVVLEKLSYSKGPLQIRSLLGPAIINIVWSVVTGTRIDRVLQLESFLALLERRMKAFDLAGGTLSFFPWLRHLAPRRSGYEVLVMVNRELKSLLQSTIENHKEKYIPGSQADLIDMFLTEMYEGKGPQAGYTDDHLFAILLDVFLPTTETTAITLDFLFLHMAVHPDVQAKVHAELDRVVGDKDLPSSEDRARLPYTEAVIMESQRLRFVAPIIGPRRALVETSLDGYRIPKDTALVMNVYSIHSDPKNYEYPQSFRPERFIDEGVFVADKRLMFFGTGHRRCPGEAVARQAVFLFFAGIIKRYQLLPVAQDLPLDTEPIEGISISPKPYRLLLVDRRTSLEHSFRAA